MNQISKWPARVVILGAGFGGVYAFKKLHKIFHRDPRVKLALVNNRNYFLFTPLLHEVATGGVSRENVVEPLRKVLGCCLAEFHLAEVQSVDLHRRQVITKSGRCDYDYLVVALGAETNFYGIPGAEEHSFTLKSLEDAVQLKNHFIKKFECVANVSPLDIPDGSLHFVVVGGGATGVELAAEMSELFYETFERYYENHAFFSKVKITLLQSQGELLHRFPKKMQEKSLEVLRGKNIDVRLGTKAVKVGEDYIELDTGEILPTETVIWVAGIKPSEVSFSEGVERDSRGKIIVNEFLQMKSHPEIVVLGDIAAFRVGNGRELPTLAQVATKEAEGAALNISRLIRGEPLQPFSYKHTGDLVSIGQWMAVAQIKKFYFSGRFAWWLWRTVYLFKLISFPKKIKVAADWTFNLFMPRDISEL